MATTTSARHEAPWWAKAATAFMWVMLAVIWTFLALVNSTDNSLDDDQYVPEHLRAKLALLIVADIVAISLVPLALSWLGVTATWALFASGAIPHLLLGAIYLRYYDY